MGPSSLQPRTKTQNRRETHERSSKTGPDAQGLSVRAPKRGITDTLEDVRHEALFDLGVRWERLRRRPYWAWLAPLGFTLVGAGIGAIASDAKWDSTGVLLSLIVGGVLLMASRMVGLQRVESLEDLCDDFMRYLDRWPCEDPDHDTNSAHVQAIASQSSGTKTLVGFGLRRFVSGGHR